MRQVCILAHVVHGFLGIGHVASLRMKTKVSHTQKLRNDILPHQAFPLAAAIPKRTFQRIAVKLFF
jgi:hypothetical protein